jgi:hypothetical protein
VNALLILRSTLLCFGSMLAVTGLIVALMALGSRNTAASLAAAPIVTCADLLARRVHGKVQVSGTIVTGEPVAGPLTGRRCAWWRVSLQTTYRHKMEWLRTSGYDVESAPSVLLTDGTATIAVAVGLLDRNLHEDDSHDVPVGATIDVSEPSKSQVAEYRRRGGRPAEGTRPNPVVAGLLAAGHILPYRPDQPVWVTERTLEEGRHLLVLGILDRSGTRLRKPFLGAGGATWRRPDDTRQAARTEAGANGRMAFWMTAAGGCMLALAGLSSLIR